MIQGRVDRKEGGSGGGEGEMGSGATGRGRWGGGNGELETGMGKRGGVEVLARVGSGEASRAYLIRISDPRWLWQEGQWGKGC